MTELLSCVVSKLIKRLSSAYSDMQRQSSRTAQPQIPSSWWSERKQSWGRESEAESDRVTV